MSERNVLRHYLSDRRGLVILSVAIIAAGVVLSWNWLAAASIAPILLALAPCAAMCAVGLCMNKMGGKSSSTAQHGTAAQQNSCCHASTNSKTASLSKQGDRSTVP